jgi:protein-S-isoprenylcysteine O-methyltransferase Ste14
MIEIIVLTFTSLLIISMIISFVMAIIHNEEFIGKSPISLPFFILAKICAFTNLLLLIPYGLNVQFSGVFNPPDYLKYFALILFLAGMVLIALTISSLKKNLIFGLPRNKEHTLQTKGIFSFSRHPFYMGFLMIMLSSVILIPHIINIFCFIVAWIFHHMIMIREEQFLLAKYGPEYQTYLKRVRRYF